MDALIQFVKQENEIDYLVFGVDTKEQFLQDIGVYQAKSIPKELMTELKGAFVDMEKTLYFRVCGQTVERLSKRCRMKYVAMIQARCGSSRLPIRY